MAVFALEFRRDRLVESTVHKKNKKKQDRLGDMLRKNFNSLVCVELVNRMITFIFTQL